MNNVELTVDFVCSSYWWFAMFYLEEELFWFDLADFTCDIRMKYIFSSSRIRNADVCLKLFILFGCFSVDI